MEERLVQSNLDGVGTPFRCAVLPGYESPYKSAIIVTATDSSHIAGLLEDGLVQSIKDYYQPAPARISPVVIAPETAKALVDQGRINSPAALSELTHWCERQVWCRNHNIQQEIECPTSPFANFVGIDRQVIQQLTLLKTATENRLSTAA